MITGWSLTGPIAGSYFEDHIVLQDIGDFKGQTLKLSYEGASPVIQEGYYKTCFACGHTDCIICLLAENFVCPACG